MQVVCINIPHKKSDLGYLSVTEVLSLVIDKPFLRYWYGKNGTKKCEQIKRESQELGTEVHNLIETRFAKLGDSSFHNNKAIQMVNNFWNQFVVPFEIKPIALEVTMKDEKLKLQGTFDAHILTNKGEFIADWKTSNTLDKITVPLQLSMYAHLAKTSSLVGGVVVRIDKESDKVQTIWYENLSQYNPIWKACLKVAKYVKYGVQ